MDFIYILIYAGGFYILYSYTLIYGLTSRRIQSKLLETDENTTLAAAVEIAQQYEATARQLDAIHGENRVVYRPYTPFTPLEKLRKYAIKGSPPPVNSTRDHLTLHRQPVVTAAMRTQKRINARPVGPCVRAAAKRIIDEDVPLNGQKPWRQAETKPQHRIHTLVEAGAPPPMQMMKMLFISTLLINRQRYVRTPPVTAATPSVCNSESHVTRDIKCKSTPAQRATL